MPHRRVAAMPVAVSLCLACVAAALAARPCPRCPTSSRFRRHKRSPSSCKATGVQIYACAARKDDAAKFEWTLVAPEAELFDAAGKKIGRHYAGPTWEATDGSKVVGELKARDDGPDPNAIPWLLLAAKSTSGSGVLSKTTSIQRLRTVGGKAPSEGCAVAAHAGQGSAHPVPGRLLLLYRQTLTGEAADARLPVRQY